MAILGVGRATFFNLTKRFRVARYTSPSTGRRVFFAREDIERLRQPVRKVDSPDALS